MKSWLLILVLSGEPPKLTTVTEQQCLSIMDRYLSVEGVVATCFGPGGEIEEHAKGAFVCPVVEG